MTSVLPRRTTTETLDVLHPSHFAYRHIGPRRGDVEEMLELLGYDSLDSFIEAVVPEEIRLNRPLALPPGRSEREVLQVLLTLLLFVAHIARANEPSKPWTVRDHVPLDQFIIQAHRGAGDLSPEDVPVDAPALARWKIIAS